MGVRVRGDPTRRTQLLPGALSLGRLLVGSLALGALIFRGPRRPVPRALWPRLLVCGIGWFGVYNVALNAAERRLDAGTFSVAGQRRVDPHRAGAPTAVAFTTWAYALARTSAGKAGATTYLVPPVTVLLSWVFLGEVPPGLALLGGALCLTGVALTRR